LTEPAKINRAQVVRESRRIMQPLAFANPFDGAATDPYSTRYTQTSGHPDREIAGALPQLQARSIDLYRNNSLAYGVLDTIAQGVVGRGPRPRFLNAQADTLSKLFAEWSTTAGWDGVSTWSEVCSAMVHASCLSGDTLILWPDVGDGTGPKIDLVDAARIDTPSTHPECPSCRLGVGYDKYGRVLGYYVRKSEDPGVGGDRNDYSWFPLNKNGRINARLFKRPAVGRPRQSRGLPLLTPAIHRLRDLDEHSRIELRRAAQASKVHTIVKTPDPKAISDAFENAEITGEYGSLQELLGRSYGNTPDGSIMVLGLGEDATVSTPPQVNGGLGDYHESHLREIAGATGFPFEEVFKLYAKLNFSNARTIRLMAKAGYRNWRDKMEAGALTPTVALLVQYWWANGLLGRIPWSSDLLSVSWDWDEMEWVDPAKEVKANAEAIATGQKSIVDVCASQGKDARAIMAENLQMESEEMKMRESLGLPPKGQLPAPAAPPEQQQAPEPPDDLEDPEDVNV